MRYEAFINRPEGVREDIYDFQTQCETLFQHYPWRIERRNTPFPLDILRLPIRLPISRLSGDNSLIVGAKELRWNPKKPAEIVIARDASITRPDQHLPYGISLRFNDNSPMLFSGINYGFRVPNVSVTEVDVILTKEYYTAIHVSFFDGDNNVTSQVKPTSDSLRDFWEALSHGLNSKIQSAADPTWKWKLEQLRYRLQWRQEMQKTKQSSV